MTHMLYELGCAASIAAWARATASSARSSRPATAHSRQPSQPRSRRRRSPMLDTHRGRAAVSPSTCGAGKGGGIGAKGWVKGEMGGGLGVGWGGEGEHPGGLRLGCVCGTGQGGNKTLPAPAATEA